MRPHRPSFPARAWGLVLTSALALASLDAGAQKAVPKDPLCEMQTPERVVAIGDVHGAFDRFVAILQEARLIDARRRWIGGRAILVQTGDVVDRGADSRPALDLLRKLENDAKGAGGRVYALLGNHEIMRVRGELPYVSAGEYAAFKDRNSDTLREQVYKVLVADLDAKARANKQPFDEAAYRKKFLTETPLGLVEIRQAFLPDGEYGRWLRSHNVMVKINDVAFVHGGTTAAVAASGCAGINATARAELRKSTLPDNEAPSILTDFDGPLWFRGLVDEPPAVTATDVETTLRALNARAIVVGHTVDGTVDANGALTTKGRIRSLFDGRVFQIDTGMVGGTFFPGGRASALEFQGKTITAIYEGSREPLTASGLIDTRQPLRRAPR